MLRALHPILRRPVWLLLFLIILASAPRAGIVAAEPESEEVSHGGKSYPVRVVRATKVGTIFSYAALGTTREHTLVSWAGSTLDETKMELQCELAATAEILEVDARGQALRTLYRVHRCKGRGADLEESDLVPKDTEIEAFADESGLHFRIGGQPITEELRAALSLVLAPPAPEDERLFGSEAPRGPGDTWAVDSKAAAARFAENGLVVDPEKLGGKVTFESIAPAEDVRARDVGECIALAVEMKAADASPELPEGFQVRSGSLDVRLEGRFPVDATLPPLDEESEVFLQTDAYSDEDGRRLELRVEIARTFRARRVLFTTG